MKSSKKIAKSSIIRSRRLKKMWKEIEKIVSDMKTCKTLVEKLIGVIANIYNQEEKED